MNLSELWESIRFHFNELRYHIQELTDCFEEATTSFLSFPMDLKEIVKEVKRP